MEEIMCPHCFNEIKVEDYSQGVCPNCKTMQYYWDEFWDEEDEDGGWMGFIWEKTPTL